MCIAGPKGPSNLKVTSYTIRDYLYGKKHIRTYVLYIRITNRRACGAFYGQFNDYGQVWQEISA